MLNIIKSLPFQLVLFVALAMLLANVMPIETVRVFYAISCLLKEALMAVLPLIIFTYISAAILSMEQKAPLLLISLIALLSLSNAIAVLISYGAGTALLPYITMPSSALTNAGADITPFFQVAIPQLIAPKTAMILGIAIGLFFSFVRFEPVQKACLSLRNYVDKGLNTAFIPLLPLYVFGFVLKLQKEGALSLLFQNFGQVLLLICALIFVYSVLLYFVGTGFHFKKTRLALREILPAAITGFSTMSSAATMPVTLAATEKNTGNASFSQLVIPTTANIHLLGDGLGIPLIAMAVMGIFSVEIPSFSSYLVFVGYYCLAKFSAAGIPGGGVLILLPVMETHLGLSPEMTSLVATIYMLMDPIFSSGNVTGNGGFALIAQKICRV